MICISGYDRGHMAPNYAIDTVFGERAHKQTFLMSNIVPQRPELNQGPWKEIEQVVANSSKMSRHLVTIDDIEAATGLDFLSLLDDSAELDLEADLPKRLW